MERIKKMKFEYKEIIDVGGIPFTVYLTKPVIRKAILYEDKSFHTYMESAYLKLGIFPNFGDLAFDDSFELSIESKGLLIGEEDEPYEFSFGPEGTEFDIYLDENEDALHQCSTTLFLKVYVNSKEENDPCLELSFELNMDGSLKKL